MEGIFYESELRLIYGAEKIDVYTSNNIYHVVWK